MADPEKAMLVDGNSSHEDADDDVEEGGKDTITAQMLKNPAVMAALQGKLDSMAGTMSGYIDVSFICHHQFVIFVLATKYVQLRRFFICQVLPEGVSGDL